MDKNIRDNIYVHFTCVVYSIHMVNQWGSCYLTIVTGQWLGGAIHPFVRFTLVRFLGVAYLIFYYFNFLRNYHRSAVFFNRKGSHVLVVHVIKIDNSFLLKRVDSCLRGY